MIIKEEFLITLNSKNKIQIVKIKLCQNPFDKAFTIERMTKQFNGKETDQPSITINAGKVNRTIAEQATLQYNSLMKNYLDRGYVKVSSLTNKNFYSLSEEDLKDLLGGNYVSDQHGIPKPMLAKSADKCSASIWNKEWYISRKLNGVRLLMYYKNGFIQTASRGGGDYNVSTKHLREDPILLELFKQNPDLILDGELYKHSPEWPLQRISGLARLTEWNDECENLEYWVYDYIDLKTPFKDRYTILEEIRKLFPEDSKIKIIEQELMTGFINIKRKHDKFVQDGFEGLCARNPDKEYGVNKRSAMYLIKLKNYQDDEFKIVGVKEGLRPEDMSFILKTESGKQFAAKPIGTAEERIYYLNHKDEFIGKMATCKYFDLSQDGIPTQPIFQRIRPDDE